MPTRTSTTGSELFIVDNSDQEWKVIRYLHDWCQLSKAIDIATGYFEIGSLLALKEEWQKVDQIRILMGDEVSRRTMTAFEEGLGLVKRRLDDSLESEKEKNDFLAGVPAIVAAFKSGRIVCKVYRKEKFHAKAYITHARLEVVGSSALVGSSNFTFPGLTQNIELNVQITGGPVKVLQEWYEEHWAQAEDVTPEILKVIERHVRDYTPFEVYAKSLQEYFRGHEMTDDEWEQEESKMYPILANYQKQGYHGLSKRIQKYGGAFLCDGVGLGKTYIGLMLIEHLVKHDKKRVALFVPKAARESVWEAKIKKYLPELLGGFLSFRIYNHTDLARKGSVRQEIEQMREQADVIIIDEAHHFRNTGIRGEEGDRKSRYWEMFDLCEGKQMCLMTATPVNNRLIDLQHMLELFSRKEPAYFSMAPLGIHSLPGHIRKLENEIEKALLEKEIALGRKTTAKDIEINLEDAEQVLRDDALFEELVVQRSRSYVKQSLKQEDNEVFFPEPAPPRVVPYSVKQTYGDLLKMVEEAFQKEKPLFSLSMYNPYEYYKGDKSDLEKPELAMVAGRQKQVVSLIRTAFLKRFESSVEAFKSSCETLMKKLIAFYAIHAVEEHDKQRLQKWLARNKDLTGIDVSKPFSFFDGDADAEDDVLEPEFLQFASEKKLDAEKFDIPPLLSDALDDLEMISDFLKELVQFSPLQDKKLQALVELLKGQGQKDVVLQEHKVIIFTEFKDTARYIGKSLREVGLTDIVEIDSETSSDNRYKVIQAFAPYYNDSSSPKLVQDGLKETRILIATDVLSEGLNLQDCMRLINYDLHWNPVRLMQRIGRIDRRLDPKVEEQMKRDHEEIRKHRGKVQYYNFLPPDELNELLSLYRTVTHKTLRISKTFGIENGKLLRPDDDFDVFRDFVRQCDGQETKGEILRLELQQLLKEDPDLAKSLSAMPNKVFSGKEALSTEAKGVFFCYARPARDPKAEEWTAEAGDVKWYLYDISSQKVMEDPYEIIKHIRSRKTTPRKCQMGRESLIGIREAVDKHLKNTYLRQVQAPIGVKPTLKTWMELS